MQTVLMEAPGVIAQPDKDEKESLAVFYDEVEKFKVRMQAIMKKCEDMKGVSDLLYYETATSINRILDECEKIEREFKKDPLLLKKTRAVFREMTNDIFSQSFFANHARTWPLGYAGDHTMVEAVYRNAPRSRGIGFYIDKMFLNTSLAVAIRGRLKKLAELLRVELTERSHAKILNVACGSCREIFDVSPEFIQSGAHAVCLDFDPRALSYANEQLEYVGIEPEHMLFRQYNAIKMVSHERNLKEFGMQDVIYSTGFYDYVNDEILVRLLKAAYQLLTPGGRLIASFKDCDKYKSREYHWIVKWDAFLQRTEADCDLLFEKAGIPRPHITTTREESGVIKFYIATK